jgi:hypothetical protein
MNAVAQPPQFEVSGLEDRVTLTVPNQLLVAYNARVMEAILTTLA